MLSIITATFASSRVNRVKALSEQIKEVAGVPTQHIIVVDGNEETYKLLKEKKVGDDLILLPRNIEWNKATNIGEKLARFPYISSIDDDTHLFTDDIFKKALRIFDEKFPDQMGVLGFSNGEQNCPEWITTRKYAYQENLGNFVWPEYWHNGDRETYLKASRQNKYTWSAELVVADVKIHDASRSKSLECYVFDDPLLKHREGFGFPKHAMDLSSFPKNDRIRYLEGNYYNE